MATIPILKAVPGTVPIIGKPAPVDRPVNDLIQNRWSPHAFESRSIDREDLLALFEAARWAPSSYNEQPWSFVIATSDDAEAFERIAGVLVEANQVWARTAPVLGISIARMSFSRNGKPNAHARHDLGMAMGNLLAEATSRGLAVHQMAGFDSETARAALGIPPEFEPVAAFAIGYAGDGDALPDELRERERAPRWRRPVAGFLFFDRWGQTLAS